MLDGEEVSMEGLPPEGGQRRLRLRAELAGLGLEMRAVDGIPQKGVADMGQMHPDLVGPPGLEPAGEQRSHRLAVAAVEDLAHLPMGDRLAAALAHRHLLARKGMAVDRRVDGAALAVGYAPDKGEI